MKFSPTKVQAFFKRLQLKPCPMCNSTNWTTDGSVNVLYQLDQNNQQTNQVSPVLLLSCQSCGYTHMFSATIANIME